jgi:hypothetical protein
MGLLSKIKRASGLDGLSGIKQSLKENTGFDKAEDSLNRLRSGSVSGFLADPAGLFGQGIHNSELFNKIADPANLLPDGSVKPVPDGIQSIDDLIRERTPEALGILQQGSDEALRLNELGRTTASDPLQQFTDLAAFNEQQALLGTSGAQAQEQAIGNIPVSAFDKQLQERRRKTQLRQANAAGELNSGATILGAQQLAGRQQSDIISKRLAELEPLVAVSRGARSTLSGIDEATSVGKAQIQTGLGTQQGNIRLGSTAPLIQSNLNQAELSGLRGIGKAPGRGEIVSQLATLAGQFVQRPETGLNTPPPPSQPFPEAGIIGVA